MREREAFPANDRHLGEYLRENCFPVLEVTCRDVQAARRPGEEPVITSLRLGIRLLENFARCREVELGPRVVVGGDIDYVFRDPPGCLGALMPGVIPRASLSKLEELKSRGVHLFIVTNQPLDGHQIAAWVGRLRGYPRMKDTLLTVLGEEAPIFSAERDWGFIFRPPKRRKETIEAVSKWLSSLSPLPDLVAYIGDRFDMDGRFWAQVQERVPPVLQENFVFVKLPNPFDRFPSPLNRLAWLMP